MPRKGSPYGGRWEKQRRSALRRDKGLCVACRESGRLTPATEVDHVVRVADGGSDRLSNLQSLCRPCHEAKTKDENRGYSIGCDPQGNPIDAHDHWQ